MDLRQQYAGKKVLVTGGAGFIGSHLVDTLVEYGAQICVVDNLADGRRDNLDNVIDSIDFREGSITDAALVEDVIAGRDYVFHLAANALVPRSSADPAYDFEANGIGLFRMADAMRKHGSGRLLFASSAAVYGEPQTDRMAEDHPFLPKSPYGGTKLGGEFLLDAFARCYDFDLRRVRIFNTFGPRQRKYVMFDLLEKLRRDQQHLEVLGTGLQVRDYNYVGDSVLALLRVGCHPDARGNVYNIAGGKPISIRDLVELIVELVDIPRPEIEYTMQSWPGDVDKMIADTAAVTALGFEPAVGLRDGIRHLIDWHREEFAAPW